MWRRAIALFFTFWIAAASATTAAHGVGIPARAPAPTPAPRSVGILARVPAPPSAAPHRNVGILARAQTPTSTTPDPRFGAVEAFWAPDEAAAAGVGWERILFYWREIQPTGPQDWNTLHVLEEWLTAAQAQGREVVGVLKQTPAWATDGVENAGIPRGLYLPPDHSDNLWANYVRRIAAYYGPRGVHHWVIWNEPDIAAGVHGYEFAGSVADYYRLLKVAYVVMKETDPQAVIHLAGLTFWHDEVAGQPQYLQRLLEIAAADPSAADHHLYFDVISLHIYFRSESVPLIVASLDDIQRQFGLDKPIWINETNAAPNQDPAWPVARREFDVSLDQQAWFLVQAHALGFAAGAARIGVYKFSDVLAAPGSEPFGLLRADLTPRPAYAAYQQMTQLLGGFTQVSLSSTAAYHRVTFRQPERLVHVLWARAQLGTLAAAPATAGSAQATLIDLSGQAQPITAINGNYLIPLAGANCDSECIIGGAPRYLLEPLPQPTITPPPTATAPPPPTAVVQPIPSITPPPTLTRIIPPSPTATSAPPPPPIAAASPPPPLGFWLLGLGGVIIAGILALARRRTQNP